MSIHGRIKFKKSMFYYFNSHRSATSVAVGLRDFLSFHPRWPRPISHSWATRWIAILIVGAKDEV